MKKIIIVCLILLAALNVKSQLPAFNWVVAGGGSSADGASQSVLDSAGNIITIGGFAGTVDFDPGPGVFTLSSVSSSSSNGDIFILKLTANGNFLWAKSLGSKSYKNGADITIDNQQNIVISGEYYDTLDCDPGPGVQLVISKGEADFFVLKLNSAGNFKWVKSIGSFRDDAATTANTDASGNIYVTGSFMATVDFDPGSAVANLSSPPWYYNCFVVKFDSVGNYLWADKFGGTNNDFGYAFEVAPSGDVYATGHFAGIVDFDPGAGTYTLDANNGSIFLIKLTSQGNLSWAKNFGSFSSSGRAIKTDPSGNILIGGYFMFSADFDPGPGFDTLTVAGNEHVFISKFDQLGNFMWSKKIAGAQQNLLHNMTVDGSGEIYFTGAFSNVADFDPGPGTFTLFASTWGIYVCKLNAFGNLVSALQFQGSCSIGTGGLSIITDNKSGAVYTSGMFKNTMDFDPGTNTYTVTSTGADDYFIQKMSAFPGAYHVGITNQEHSNNGELAVYPNPSGGQFVISSTFSSAIKITDVLGTTVLDGRIEKGENLIDLRKLPGGIYFLTEEFGTTYRLIIAR